MPPHASGPTPEPGGRALVRGFGTRIEVTAPTAAVARAIAVAICADRGFSIGDPGDDRDAAALACTVAGDGPWTVALGDTHLGDAPDLDDLVERVLGALDHAVACHARGLVFVHAGCVARSGHAIVLPGRSLAGKSTLVAELVRQGAAYLSDEYAVLELDGRLLPYPRPVSIRDEAGIGRPTPVQALGGSQHTDPVTRLVVVDTRYTDGATFTPVPVARRQAVLALLDNTVTVRDRPEDALDAVSRATIAAAWRSPRGDAAETAAILLAAVDTLDTLQSG